MKRKLDSRHWDAVADKVSGPLLQEDVADYYRQAHLEMINTWAGDLKGKKVLKTDLYEDAFGSQHFLYRLAQQGADVFGMDISPKMLFRARQRIAGEGRLFDRGVACDVLRASFKDDVFDLIISNSTLDHLSVVEARSALVELRRVLKPGGLLILTLDNRHNPFFYYGGYLVQKFFGISKFYLDKCYTLDEARRLAEESRFKVEEAAPLIHVYPPWTRILFLLDRVPGRFFKKAVRSFIRACASLGKKTKFRTSWFIALKLSKRQEEDTSSC